MFIVLALRTQRCVAVPNAVPSVFDTGLTPDPPDDVIPAVVTATLTVEFPSDIVVELANNPFDVEFIVPDWTDIVSTLLAEITNLPIELPSNIVFDVGTIPVVFASNPLVLKLAAFIVPV